MTQTAVGLFDHHSTAAAVAESLHANGFSSKAIHILSQPLDVEVESATSTPGIDFEARLAEDLQAMGASSSETKAYVACVRDGNALVFASCAPNQTDTAVSVMNAYHPLKIEEFSGSALPVLPGVGGKEVQPHDPITLNSEAERAKSEGARVFTW